MRFCFLWTWQNIFVAEASSWPSHTHQSVLARDQEKPNKQEENWMVIWQRLCWDRSWAEQLLFELGLHTPVRKCKQTHPRSHTKSLQPHKKRSKHCYEPEELWAIIPRAQKLLCIYQARGSEDWGARRSTGASFLSHAFDATLVGGSKTFFWRFYTRMFAPDTQVACKKRFANVSRHIVAPTSVRYSGML